MDLSHGHFYKTIEEADTAIKEYSKEHYIVINRGSSKSLGGRFPTNKIFLINRGRFLTNKIIFIRQIRFLMNKKNYLSEIVPDE